MSPQPQAQRTTGEALVAIEGLEFANGVIEAEIAGTPAPGPRSGVPAQSVAGVGLAVHLRKRNRQIEVFVRSRALDHVHGAS